MYFCTNITFKNYFHVLIFTSVFFFFVCMSLRNRTQVSLHMQSFPHLFIYFPLAKAIHSCSGELTPCMCLWGWRMFQVSAGEMSTPSCSHHFTFRKREKKYKAWLINPVSFQLLCLFSHTRSSHFIKPLQPSPQTPSWWNSRWVPITKRLPSTPLWLHTERQIPTHALNGSTIILDPDIFSSCIFDHNWPKGL